MSHQSKVKIQSPFGNLTLHNNATRPAGLLGAGIGITALLDLIEFLRRASLFS